MSHHDDKKERKKAQIAKNRKQQEIFQAFRQMRGEGERAMEQQRENSAPSGEPAAKAEWSDKVAVIRNRLTGAKRTSRERWNRFAGTGGEGGRGL